MEQKSSLKDFVILNKLGEGSFCQVFKVKRLQDGIEYAMKKVKMSSLSQKEKQSALMEIRVLASINSPYIISYKDCFLDESSNTLCIIMECATGGDIMKKLENCKKSRMNILEKDIWKALEDMAKGLLVLHEMNIYHRDLKGANIFIGADGHYKLGDLNVSTVSKAGFAKTQTGTPYYCCPEIWADKPYDAKCDIWSLGCMYFLNCRLYEMCTLLPPFRANDMRGLVAKVNRGVYDPIRNYSNDLSLIIDSMIKVNPKQRPSSKELLQNPILLRRLTCSDSDQPIMPSKMELMNTIKLPQNLLKLKEALPSAQYNQKKLQINVSVDQKLELKEQLEKNIPIRQSEHQPIQRSNSASKLQQIQQPRYPISSRNQIEVKQPVVYKPLAEDKQTNNNHIPRPQSYKPPINPYQNKVPQPQKNVNLPRIPQSPRKDQTPKYLYQQYLQQEQKQMDRASSRNKDSRNSSKDQIQQTPTNKPKIREQRAVSDYRKFY